MRKRPELGLLKRTGKGEHLKSTNSLPPEEEVFGDLNFGDDDGGAAHRCCDVELSRRLGVGNFGTVHAATHLPTGRILAAKRLPDSLKPRDQEKLLAEIQAVRKGRDCANIVDYFGVEKREGYVFIFMEIMEVSLCQVYKRANEPMPEAGLAYVAVSILAGLAYLYQQHKIMHCDVKPSNMLLGHDGAVKLCDFGLSKVMEQSLVPACGGSERYLAPERLDPYTIQTSFDDRSDVWAYGISLIEIGNRAFPYPEAMSPSDGFQLQISIIRGPAPCLNQCYTPIFREFVESCVHKDVRRRPRLAKPSHEIGPLLNHPFILKHNDAPKVDILGWYHQQVETAAL